MVTGEESSKKLHLEFFEEKKIHQKHDSAKATSTKLTYFLSLNLKYSNEEYLSPCYLFLSSIAYENQNYFYPSKTKFYPIGVLITCTCHLL